ncbi:GNAT family N-acetyltransferase [candidate division KSB1 bacterium]|nr:GNAT family N-acetyltransferase [candidate division KSB1 bacterium]
MITYTDSVEKITFQMLQGFFEGWKKPCTPEEHLEILRNSNHIVLAIDSDQDKVVGFITALTDRMQSAFIPLLEVLPGYRRRGIGSTLVSRMLEKLKGIPAIDLTCDPVLQRFYSKFGMVPSVGMIIRDY